MHKKNEVHLRGKAAFYMGWRGMFTNFLVICVARINCYVDWEK